MCGVWCSSCFLSPGLLIGVTAFTGTLVYCVNVEEQWLDELWAFRWKPKTLSLPCIIAIQNACLSCINNYCIMLGLPIQSEILLTVITVFQRLLCTCFLQQFSAVHSKESFMNVTAPLRLPVSHLALYGHTSCQVTRVQSHGLLWECTEIPEIFYRYLRCERVCGGCEAGWEGLCNVGMQKLTMRLSDRRYAVCHEVKIYIHL